MTLSEVAELALFLEATPDAVKGLIADLTDERVRWKSSDVRFSAVEHLCHLRDLEAEGYGTRIRRILEEQQPFLPNFDGERLARERGYQKQEPGAALAAFTEARQRNVRLIKSLSEEQLKRCGNFEHAGSICLVSLLRLMREHDEAHLQELTDLRAQLFGS